MIRFAYPTAKADDYGGCGRYEVRPPAQVPQGYSVADPEPSEISEIMAAAALFAPEASNAAYEIYEIKDRSTVIARGDSLGLAYLLALISRSRRLRLDSMSAAYDIWVTGAIKIAAGGEPCLKAVTGAGFDHKLAGFLSQSSDTVFIGPVANLDTPTSRRLCRENDVRVLSLPEFGETMTSPQELFNKKTIIKIHEFELHSLVETLFVRAQGVIWNESSPSSFALDLVVQKTWAISIDHLSSVLDPEEYDENANLRYVGRKIKKRKFNEKLFVSPQEESVLEHFFASDKRGIIFIGKSGIGKSNLICSSFLKQRRKREIGIFIDARRMRGANIRELLKSPIMERMGKQCDIREFDRYLETIQKKIILFIDAVNEYSNTDGPLILLQNIINFVEDPNVFNNIKIIVSCRSETWNQYKEYVDKERSILNDEVFLTACGDAIPIAGFEGEKEREALFCAYQQYYNLLPNSYKSHSQTFKELIKHPFMIGIIAETYSNIIQDYKEQKIPKNLDYFALFKQLTERKMSDAQRLLSTQESKRKSFEDEFNDCLFIFADLLYKRLAATVKLESTHSDRTPLEPPGVPTYADRTDSLPIGLLHRDQDFSRFIDRISAASHISIFDTILQVGLIEPTYIVEYDYWGNKKEGKAYKFFHDQYTQYWLSAIYSKNILGRISSEDLVSDSRRTESIISKIQTIIDNSKYAPVLASAVDHWLHSNMSSGRRNISDFLYVLFNQLVINEYGAMKFYVSSFLYSLIEKNIIEPKILFQNMFEYGNFQLKKCLTDHILQLGTDISSECFRSLIEACDDEQDDEILRGIGDIFADLFEFEPQKVIQFLDITLHGFDRKTLSRVTRGILDKDNLIKHITFIAKFFLKTVITNYSDIEKMVIVREFLRRKFKYIIDAALLNNNRSLYSIKGILRSIIYRKLEYDGIHQWDQAIGSQEVNNTFFVEDNGLVQRDILYEYYPYVAAFHNGEIELLSLNKESSFRKITMQMINYREASIIGYVATVLLSSIIKNNLEMLDEIIDELIALNSTSSRYFTSLLLMNLGFMDQELCPTILELFLNRFLPHLISNNDYNYMGYSVFFVVSSINIDLSWEYSRNILDYLYEILTKTNDVEKLSILEDNLPFCCFVPEIKIGMNIISYMIERKLLAHPLWRTCALKVFAGMLARNPKTLHNILTKAGIDTAILNEVRPLINERMLEMKEVSSYQSNWNGFIVAGLSFWVKLRYFLIKDLLGGLIQSNSVEEYAKEFRRFVIETARGFLNEKKNESHYLSISLAQALEETESKRIPDGGKRWVPRAVAPALSTPHQKRSAEVGGRSG